jgi:imidazolonepropionase-like amidohydrolase
VHRRGIYVVPTVAGYIMPGTWGDPSEWLTDPFLRGVERRLLDTLRADPMVDPVDESGWAYRREVLQMLKDAHEAGVELVCGTDPPVPYVFHGYSVHQELELMVEAGLTPMEALVTATRRPAEMLGEQDVFGTVEPGKRADLLILSANPLEDIRNTRTLETVVLDGRVIDRSAPLPDVQTGY